MNIQHLNRVFLAIVISSSLLGFGTIASAKSPVKELDQKNDAQTQVDKVDQKKPRQGKEQNNQQLPEQLKNQHIMNPPPQAAQGEKEQRKPLPPQSSQEQMRHQQMARIQAAEQQQTARENADKDTLKRQMKQRHNENAAEKNKAPRLLPPQKPAQHARLPQQEQQALIRQQQQRVVLYRQNVDQHQNNSRQHGLQLQQQKRMSQYRFQQQYYERMRLQQISFRNNRYDYNNDPYYYTASSYRYYRDGRNYETNQYGANTLRQALNYGYQEGMRAGRADQQDHWRYSYRDSYIYEDANYGYNGYYVQQDDYNYYFRQGFQRGYEDGYYGRRQYGRTSNGSDSLLSTVLTTILNLQSIR